MATHKPKRYCVSKVNQYEGAAYQTAYIIIYYSKSETDMNFIFKWQKEK